MSYKEFCKQTLIQNITHNVYCELRPSPVHGVGVFAMRPIARGTDPFKRVDEKKYLKQSPVSREEVEAMPEHARRVIEKFFIAEPNADRRMMYPVCDPNAIDISFYLNHAQGSEANMRFGECNRHQHCHYDHLYALRDIAADEELLIDYYNAGEEVLYTDKSIPLPSENAPVRRSKRQKT